MSCLFWYDRHSRKFLSKEHLTYTGRLLKIFGRILKYSQCRKNKFSGYLFTHENICKGTYKYLSYTFCTGTAAVLGCEQGNERGVR